MNNYSLLVFLLVAIIATAFFVKPLRLLVPEWYGMHCEGSVCVEEIELLDEADVLYQLALTRLQQQTLSLESKPEFVYCSTASCYKYFGGKNERAISYPFLGTIIAPSSWQIYISQHELVHWIQFEKLGAIATMQKPVWFREGMAYQFSDAPATDIPKHYLPLIEKYKSWHSNQSWKQVWGAAKDL